jgi:hypothetical protein
MKQINSISRQYSNNNQKLKKEKDSLEKYSLDKGSNKIESQNINIIHRNMNMNMNMNLMNLTNINKQLFNKSLKNKIEKNSTLFDINKTENLSQIIPNKNSKQNPTVLKSSFIAGAIYQNRLNMKKIITNLNDENLYGKDQENIGNVIEGQMEKKKYFHNESVNKLHQNIDLIFNNKRNENFTTNNITEKSKNLISGNKISESLNYNYNNYDLSQNEERKLIKNFEDKGIF